MSYPRNSRSIILAVASVVGVLWITGKPSYPPAASALTVYDSALLTLRDFVAAGDDKLGFRNVKEFDNASIDLAQGVQVYFLRHDTARSSFNAYDTVLMDLGRVVYPVYTQVNGAQQLRSCITFDSLGGVHPVMFDDSTLILAAVQYRRSLRKPMARCGMIMVPSLGINATVAHTATGDSIVESDDVRRAIGRRTHRMSTNDFVQAVRVHMQGR